MTNDVTKYIESVKESFTYKFNGSHMIIMSILSDCQEMLDAQYPRDEIAQEINLAKRILLETVDGHLNLTVEK